MTNEIPNSDFNLVIDAGGFSRGSDDFSRLQNEYLVKAMTWMEYSAINFGYKEFQLNPSFIKKLQIDLHPPFISANVYLTGTAKTFLQPFIIKELVAQTMDKKPAVKRLKVAMLGLCDNKLSPLFISRPGEPQLEYRDPIEIAKNMAPQLRKKADIVILLYYGKYEELIKILTAAPEIDLAVMGGEYYMVNKPQKDEKTLLVTTPLQGKYVGVLTLQLDKKKRIIGSSNKQIALSEEIKDDLRFTQLVQDFDKANAQPAASGH